MKPNVSLSYLYRDAANYKFFNTVVFQNPDALSVEGVFHALHKSFLSDHTFVADQVHLPEMFPYIGGTATDDDHCLHELDAVEETDDEPTDSEHRSITEFLKDVEHASLKGWQGFVPTGEENTRQRFKLEL